MLCDRSWIDGGSNRGNQYGLTAESFRPGLRGTVVYSRMIVDGAGSYGLVVCDKATGSLVTIRDVQLRGTAMPPAHWPEPWLTIPPVGMGSCGNTCKHKQSRPILHQECTCIHFVSEIALPGL